MATPLARTISRLSGWLADRKLPTFLRAPVFRVYARATGADLSELRLQLADHPSLAAFFVRRLKEGARQFSHDPDVLPSPVDGCVQSLCTIERGTVVQAKGRPYAIEELLGDAELARALEGGSCWTIYLSPRDYHRIHSPLACELGSLTWHPGSRYSVNPKVLARRPKVLSINERAVLRLDTEQEPFILVAVGAVIVGRIRIVGVEPQAAAPRPALRFGRGEELARFEMGSTVVLLSPRAGFVPTSTLAVGDAVKMGQPIGRRSAP
jgi:phosphatidylserine decarboxylase